MPDNSRSGWNPPSTRNVWIPDAIRNVRDTSAMCSEFRRSRYSSAEACRGRSSSGAHHRRTANPTAESKRVPPSDGTPSASNNNDSNSTSVLSVRSTP